MYLSNTDLLREIHESKMTFCWVAAPEYGHFDAIHTDLDSIDWDAIPRRRPCAPCGRPVERVVRVYTLDHVPRIPGVTVHARDGRPLLKALRFRPFRHFIRRGDRLVEVARSHWQGDLRNGRFRADHGRLTDRLVQMIIALVQNYSRRANWRGYSWIDEMRAEAVANLTEAALIFDEAVSDNPFGYYTRIAQNAFRGVLAREERHLDIRDSLLEAHGFSPRFDTLVKRELEARARDG